MGYAILILGVVSSSPPLSGFIFKIKSLKIKGNEMEWGGQKEGTLTHYHSWRSIVDPNRKSVYLTYSRSCNLPTPAGGRLSPPPATAQPMRDSPRSTNEKPRHRALGVKCSNELSLYSGPTQLPPSSPKEGSSLQSCLWPCCGSCLPGCNSLLFPSKPTFAGTITGSLFIGSRFTRTLWCGAWLGCTASRRRSR